MLIDIAFIKGVAEQNGICEILGSKDEIKLFPKEFTPELAKDLMPKIGNGVRLVTSEPMHFSVKLKAGESVVSVLRKIVENM